MNPESNQLKDVSRWITQSLREDIEAREREVYAQILLQDLLGFSRAQMILGDFEVSAEQLELIDQALKRLNENEPIQQVVGKSWFYGLEIITRAGMLIPRPETEELVEEVLTFMKGKKGKVLDLCTGSGCIALAIKSQRPDLEVHALEKSREAMDLAKENGEALGLDVKWIHEDIFTWLPKEHYSVVVSNPPYIPVSEQKMMHERVTRYEPEMALFVEDHDPQVFYKRIAEIAYMRLSPKGSVFCELHEDLSEGTAEVFHERGFDKVKILKDLQGKNRIAWVR